MRKKRTLGLVGAIMLGFAIQAHADIIAVGDVRIGSWAQEWQLTETGAPFDHVQMFLLGGGPSWTVTESSANWSVTSANETTAILDGAPSGGLYGIYNFTTAGVGNLADALFLTQKWNTSGGTPVLMREYLINTAGGAGYAATPGGGWYIKVLTPGESGQEYQATVPDGGLTAVLLGMAMVGLGCVRRRVK